MAGASEIAGTRRSSEELIRASGWMARLAPILVIAGLVLVHATVNWHWLAANVTSTGADKAEHLARSLRYYQILTPFTVRGLFTTLVENPIRPSLFPLSATVAYRLLGLNVDAGPMINIPYLAILLAATYGLGARLKSRKVGLLATVLVGTYPMIFAMSRLFYIELALTAMVAATIYFLIASDGFKNRWTSLLFGLCLGLGLLTKRTFVAFVWLPILYVVLRSGQLQALWRRLRRSLDIHWRALFGATAGGALLAALWYWPNREMIATLVLGHWLFFAWWLLAALTLYLVSLPSSPGTNLLAAISAGATVASVWYLGRIEFIVRAANFAYGDVNSADRSFAWLAPSTYSYYLYRIIVQHISPLHFVFSLLAGGVLLALWWRRRSRPGPAWWVLGCWFIGGYALLTFTLYRQSRAALPLLPVIALLTAAGLLELPWRRLRTAVVALVLTGAIVQWLVLSFTPLHVVADSLDWGSVRVFAVGGGYVVWPDYGPTDPGWAVHDDLLSRMEQARQAEGRETMRLGLLSNVTQLNAPQFQPLILSSYPALVVDGLTRSTTRGDPAYPRLFDYDFVAIKQHNRVSSQEDQAVIDRLLTDPPRTFAQAFELVKTYSLPDNDPLYLYEQRYPMPADLDPAYLAGLSAHLAAVARPGDAIWLDTPGMLAPLARSFASAPDFYLGPLSDADLAHLAEQHERIFVVSWGQAHLDTFWLAQNTHGAASDWFGDIHLALYGTASNLKAADAGVQFDQTVVLRQYALPNGPLAAGDLLPFTLTWQASSVPASRLKIFAHLLAADGRLVAQYDGEPAGGTRPTDGWTVGEIVQDRRGVLLPQDLEPGRYDLVIGLYMPDDGTRLQAQSTNGEPLGTEVVLGAIEVNQRRPQLGPAPQ